MKFMVTIFVVFIAAKVLRPVIEDLRGRIEKGMPGGKMETKPTDVITGVVALVAFGIGWQMLDRTVLTFFVIWIGWQLIKSVLESLQDRAREQLNPQQGRKSTFAQGRDHRHEAPGPQPLPGGRSTFATGRPHRHQAQRPPGGGERSSPLESLSDLERLFTEAMERKIGMEQSPAQARRRAVQPTAPQQRIAQPRPEAESDPWIPAQPEPRREVRREVRVERERVARPSRREAARQAVEKAKARPARAGTRKRREPPRRAARVAPSAQIPLLGRLNKNDVRRGIIIAEILGSPKGLRDDIESHVI